MVRRRVSSTPVEEGLPQAYALPENAKECTRQVALLCLTPTSLILENKSIANPESQILHVRVYEEVLGFEFEALVFIARAQSNHEV